MMLKAIGRELVARGWRLAVAESATGGLLGREITRMPGSSAFFWGGVIAYANDTKMQLLGVQQESLTHWGAVSAPVALEMATGACKALGVEVALSITGIAGPTGATAFKPLGLYYLGLAVPGECWCWRHHFTGDRETNNQSAAEAALAHLLGYLRPNIHTE
jgi:PncC family amidohydrolase